MPLHTCTDSSALAELSSVLTVQCGAWLAAALPRAQRDTINKDYIADMDQFKKTLISLCPRSAAQLRTRIITELFDYVTGLSLPTARTCRYVQCIISCVKC